MSKPITKKSLFKDFALMGVLAGMLILIPMTRDHWFDTTEGSSVSAEKLQIQMHTTPIRVPEVEEGKEFIEEVFPKVSEWELSAIEPYLAQETKTEVWDSQIDAVLTTLSSRLGSLESFSEPQSISLDGTPTDSDGDELAVYEFVAYYESGIADINLVLAEYKGEAALYSFNIRVQDSQAL